MRTLRYDDLMAARRRGDVPGFEAHDARPEPELVAKKAPAKKAPAKKAPAKKVAAAKKAAPKKAN